MRAASEQLCASKAPPKGLARRARFAPLLSAVALVVATPRHAAADPAAAEALFQEGRRLLQRGEIDEACEQLGESQRLDPSSGTLINLADCHERQGKTATAWAEFLAASRLAVVQKNNSRAEEAGRRATVLESQLSYLTLRVAAPPPGLKVQRDGQPVQGVQLGARLPVDPGEHSIVAEAPGYARYEALVTVQAGGDDVRVWIPPLWVGTGGLSESVPSPVKARGRAAEPAPSSPSERRTLGYVAGGLGALSLGVGAFFGFKAIASNNDAERACPTHSTCPPAALEERSRADTQAWASNITIGAGLVGLAVGGYLIFFDPSRTAPPSGQASRGRLAVRVAPGGLGITGAF